MWDSLITQLLNPNNRGRLIGVVLGLFFGFLAVVFGILKALFITLCAIVGYYLGKRVDEQGDFKSLVDKVINRE